MSRRTGTPVSYEDQRQPRVSADGMTWVDQDGNPPDVDKEGRLRAPFTTVDHFRTERWGAGTLLPLTPAANSAVAAAAAALAASKRPTGGDNGAPSGNSPKEDDMSAVGTKAATKSHTRAVPKPSGKKGARVAKLKQLDPERKPTAKEKAMLAKANATLAKVVDKLVVDSVKPTGKVNGEHPTTDHLDKAKREGVRVASASRGGFHVIVFGTLNRALKGVFPEAAQAKAAAVAAGLDVKGMPK